MSKAWRYGGSSAMRGDRQCAHQSGRRPYRPGDYASAHVFLEESRTITRELDDKWVAGILRWALGNLAIAERDFASARTVLEEAMAMAGGHDVVHPLRLEGFGCLAAAEGLPARAARLLGRRRPCARALARPCRLPSAPVATLPSLPCAPVWVTKPSPRHGPRASNDAGAGGRLRAGGAAFLTPLPGCAKMAVCWTSSDSNRTRRRARGARKARRGRRRR